MKKLLLCLAILLCVCTGALAGGSPSSSGAENLPQGIEEYLSESSRWAAWEVTGWANPDGQEDHFVALHKSGANELLCFEYKDGAFHYRWHNGGALPDNGHPFILADATGTTNLYTDETYVKPMLWSYYVLNDELCDFSCCWEKQDSLWMLESYSVFEPGEFYAQVFPSRLEIRTADTGKYPTIVKGVAERNLRYLDAGTLPLSVKEARTKLSSPPQIPQGELSAQRIKFTGGRKYKVYTGPGEYYGQSGSGKAVVSTNDWIQVFGRMDEWLLIQYDITSDRMRIGWISAAALPKGTDVPYLDFHTTKARVNTPGASLTDDPLFSRTSIALLEEGAQVTIWSAMGDWSYVEVHTNTFPRTGFVATSMLDTVSYAEQARNHGANSLTEIYGYSRQEVDESFVFEHTVEGDELIVTMYPEEHPAWKYTTVLSLRTGKHVRSSTPFHTGYAPYPGEGTVRDILRVAQEQGWFSRWSPADRAQFRERITSWEVPMTPALAAALDSSDTAGTVITEFFLACYGDSDAWPQALTEWHGETVKNILQNVVEAH